MEYFHDAVEQAWRSKKALLIVYGDNSDREISDHIVQFFNDEGVQSELEQNFVVYGIQSGSAEGDQVNQEF